MVRVLPVLASSETFSAIADLPNEVTDQLIEAGDIPTVVVSGLRRVKVRDALKVLCSQQTSAGAEGLADAR